ncbi:MAG: putative beta-lysine N-acetyltransferase [Bacteroidales bacterium]|nr:putative beta-lysine N-acetyltransferase [Bacteroidales bacterium]
MIDTFLTLGKGSKIQHGKHNNRIYLMKFDASDTDTIIGSLNGLANEYGYSKIFCKVPKWTAPLFFANGFILEAFIPLFFANETDVFFVSKFFETQRALSCETEDLKGFSKILSAMPAARLNNNGNFEGLKVRKLVKSDILQVTKIYSKVFKSYPFPVFKPEYIEKTMDENVHYYGVLHKGIVVAISSAEIDFEGQNAEMTDFATLPAFRGKGLARLLLSSMESDMKELGILTLYTIARLRSEAMNKTFMNLNYQYSGTLVNNTNIAGNIESMNVYFKHI